MNAILPSIVAAVAVALVIGWLEKKTTEYNPIGSLSIIGTIAPHRGLVYFTLITGVSILSFGVLAAIYFDGMLVYGPACAFMGACFVIFSIPSLTSVHDLIWTSESLIGPKTVFFSIMGISRNELLWSEIVKTGLVKGPYYYIENNNGDRIYWARSYKGFENFEATLAEKHPTLTLPKFELFPKSNDG